jgi:hypothetical protein
MTAMWEGARNLIDLGGLPLHQRGTTASGRVWRSAAPESITADGWAAATAVGLRTVVDLRNAVERQQLREPRGIRVVHAPTEDPDDPGFLEECGPWLDHPRSWGPTMRRYPQKFARVFVAIADADGGVLIHCAGGRDRTGLVASMLLALTGVEEEAVADHYEHGFRSAGEHPGHGLGYDPVARRWALAPDRDWRPHELDAALADRRPVLLAWLRETDIAGYLADAGVDAARLDRLPRLLLGQ